ncbi:XRE family transcriptional regulator [Jannaschia pagri]|uniref:XRE family transcriptional regulator n=1 Tax=Jannaschia pagri TaxID=2829797 RepID=A0ABQ4NJG4_9RHOB|nr:MULTISPECIES: short-chain fatty acyl-CoA regulator family protein [unclassified Jannaschia]GIT90731.1 XRE family transcriptional regulator [Jannaschia sp. AI_61]GIT94563.1 XRE family transcriptional regulator [Jannaschia sp. AI_62]
MAKSGSTGSRIRERRLALGIRQAHLADQVGISASYLNLIEHDKRPIGGRLLGRLAESLSVDQSALSSEVSEGLLDALRGAGAAHDLDAEALGTAADLARRNPGWARVIVRQGETIEAQARTIEALADRLTHDPALAEAMHELLSTVSVVRSTASILAQTPEIDANWMGRFHANLDADSRRLADGAEAVVSYLDSAVAGGGDHLTPAEVVARFLDANQHSFDAVEEQGAAAIPDLVADLTDPRARRLATAILEADAQDAKRLPRDVVEAATGPDDLLAVAGGDAALVLRRLGVIDPARGLVVTDAAGALLRRKPVEGFPLPIVGAGCPLWPLYQALSQPGRAIVQTIEMPDGAQWVAHAVAAPSAVTRFDGVQTLRATMLLARAARPGVAFPVGPGCRVCPRKDCVARREPSVLPGAEQMEGAGSMTKVPQQAL